MAAGEVHENDIGTVFKLTVKDQDGVIVDISSASTKQIIFKKPGGNILTKTASFQTDGTDGIIKYTTLSGDLNEKGIWQIQAYVVITAGTFYSDVLEFKVYPNIS